MPSHLVYQVYGGDRYLAQARHALWSALAWSDRDIRIHLYTDRPAAFADLDGRVTLHRLPAGKVAEWMGPLGYVHRPKIMMLRDLTAQVSEPVLYSDVDTLFVGPVAGVMARIGPEAAVMHRREYPVAGYPSGQMRQLRRDLERSGAGAEALQVTMWNAGVVGLHPEHFAWLERVTDLLDALYPVSRMELVEQYAVGAVLQQRVALRPADDRIFHYWDDKERYQAALEARLAAWASLPADDIVAMHRADPLLLPPAQRPPLAARARTVLRQPGAAWERHRMRRVA